MKNFNFIISYIKTLFIILLVNSLVFSYIGPPVYYLIILHLIVILLILSITYKKILFILIITILMLINTIFVFIVNNNTLSFSEENHNPTVDYCLKNLENNGMGYMYHYNGNNPILPTFGIWYKRLYEENDKFIILYEKRSYFNIYVGYEKLVCPDELGGEIKTLE